MHSKFLEINCVFFEACNFLSDQGHFENANFKPHRRQQFHKN